MYQFRPERRCDFTLDEVIPIQTTIKILITYILEIGWTRTQSSASVFLQQLFIENTHE